MTLLEDNEYLTIEEYQEENLLKLIWKNTSESLNHEQDKYKSLILLWANSVQNYQPKGVVVDTRDHSVIIHPAMQQWFVDEVFPKYRLLGMKKLAFITSQDFISQLSVEQTMKEDDNLPFKTQYFSCDNEGFDWVVS